MGGDFLRCDAVEQRADAGMRHRRGNGAKAQQFPRAADHLMAAVEDADLHRLMRMDIHGKGRACTVPVGAACAEIVLDHPLAKVFMRHGCCVIDAKGLRQRHLMRAGRGHDAVDHGIGETACAVDPIGQGGVGQAREPHDRLAQDRAIALQVVAAQAGERADPLRAPLRKGRGHCAESRARGLRVFGVVLDIGMVHVQPPRRRVDVIAAFGHGQRHDADIGLRHPRDQGGVVDLHRQEIDHRACHLGRFARRVELDQRRQAALRQKPVAHRGVTCANTRTDNRPILRKAHLHQAVRVPCLMRAVEIAQPDMHDARRQVGARISRDLNASGQRAQGRQRQLCQLIHWPPSTL